jgi:hypothetical protein
MTKTFLIHLGCKWLACEKTPIQMGGTYRRTEHRETDFMSLFQNSSSFSDLPATPLSFPEFPKMTQ